MALYNFYNTNALKVYVGAGVKAKIVTYPTNIYTISTDDNGKITPSNGFIQKLQTESIYFSVPIKVGLIIHKNLDIYAAYYALGSIASFETTSSNVSTVQVGLNFIFGK